MECTEKGFIVEVAGINNPGDPPFILSTSPEKKDKTWFRMELNPTDSPHTIYMAEFTEKEARNDDWKLYLTAPGLQNPLLIAPYDEAGTQVSGNGVLPTGYRCEPYSFQDYIFIPFRPVTAIIATRYENIGGEYNYWGQGEHFCDLTDSIDTKDIKGHLRILRKGYLYIFRKSKLWREIEVRDDGTFLDIDLENNRLNSGQRIPEIGRSVTEIWLPVKTGRMKCNTEDHNNIIDFYIAFSEKQWTWPYIDWLEADHKRIEKRLDSMSALSKLYIETKENYQYGNSFSARFSPLIEEINDEKYYPVECYRADVLIEAVGVSRRLINSDE